jgi:hypothetical protein
LGITPFGVDQSPLGGFWPYNLVFTMAFLVFNPPITSTVFNKLSSIAKFVAISIFQYLYNSLFHWAFKKSRTASRLTPAPPLASSFFPFILKAGTNQTPLFS